MSFSLAMSFGVCLCVDVLSVWHSAQKGETVTKQTHCSNCLTCSHTHTHTHTHTRPKIIRMKRHSKVWTKRLVDSLACVGTHTCTYTVRARQLYSLCKHYNCVCYVMLRVSMFSTLTNECICMSVYFVELWVFEYANARMRQQTKMNERSNKWHIYKRTHTRYCV